MLQDQDLLLVEEEQPQEVQAGAERLVSLQHREEEARQVEQHQEANTTDVMKVHQETALVHLLPDHVVAQARLTAVFQDQGLLPQEAVHQRMATVQDQEVIQVTEHVADLHLLVAIPDQATVVVQGLQEVTLVQVIAAEVEVAAILDQTAEVEAAVAILEEADLAAVADLVEEAGLPDQDQAVGQEEETKHVLTAKILNK